jgi:hypothetical protein
MNPRTTPTNKAPLSSLAAEQDQTPYTVFTHDFQEMCSRAMDQAIGMEKASFDAVLQMQSRVMDACDVSNYDVSKFDASRYEAASCSAPAIGNIFDLMAQTIASCMELQLAWLTMMTPGATPQIETVLHVPAPALAANHAVAHEAANNLHTMTHAPVELLAHSMDIAIGARAA